MKKILLLGGSRYLIPIIKVCYKLGYYAVTCDNIPNNSAHKFADEYHNVSVIDKDAVLVLAQELKIDGIMSFACDPGVTTAAYVAERMGLPFQGSYKSTQILQDKGLFRKFLFENGFNSPHAKSYGKGDNVMNDVDYFSWPIIVKPVDSAGSKGVTKVCTVDGLSAAIDIALSKSHNERFIIEDFLTFKGYHSSADFFTVDGKLKYYSYSDQLFDKEADNPYTPSLIIWPSSMSQADQDYLTGELQRLMTLLEMRTGIYNVETCVGANGKPYIMEVSPRGGGDRIAEIQYMLSSIDLIEAEVRKAVGDPIDEINMPNCDGAWCEYVIHNARGQSGIFNGLQIDPDIRQKYVKMFDLNAKLGEFVEPFSGANKSLGDIFLRFNDRQELDDVMSNVSQWLRIDLKS